MKVFLSFVMLFVFTAPAYAANSSTGEYCFYERIPGELAGKLNYFFPDKENMGGIADGREFKRFLLRLGESMSDWQRRCLDAGDEEVMCVMMVGNTQLGMSSTAEPLENSADEADDIRRSMTKQCEKEFGEANCDSKITCYYNY
jgi:hypothetical protein